MSLTHATFARNASVNAVVALLAAGRMQLQTAAGLVASTLPLANPFGPAAVSGACSVTDPTADSNAAGQANPVTKASFQDTISYTDLVIDATTNTKCTSAAHPFSSLDVGRSLQVTGGTGFTVQTVTVNSVSGNVATCSASLGTLGSTGGIATGHEEVFNCTVGTSGSDINLSGTTINSGDTVTITGLTYTGMP